MGELFLVRHAQASFGSDDYDRLSELGWGQSRWLGDWFRETGVTFDRVVTGSLRRQKETAEGVLERAGSCAAEVHDGFNEYDFHGILASRFAEGGRPEGLMTDRRTHFRTLRTVLAEWSRAEVPDPPETWVAFEDRVRAALDFTCDPKQGERVLAVSSGGAISMVLRHVLQLSPEAMINLNLQAKNTGVTRLIFTGARIYLNMFNATPHLDPPDRAHAQTYA